MKRLITVARKEGSLGLIARALFVLLLSFGSSGWMYETFELGDRSGRDITGFIFFGFFYGLGLALIGFVDLLWRKRELEKLCGELNGSELGKFLEARAGSRCPFVALLRKLHAQFERNPAAVDAVTLIHLLHRRLSRTAMRVRRVGVLLVALGLVGTCVGLIGMLSGLTETVAQSDGEGGPEFMFLLFSPRGPLGGLAGAYTSTLVGIACGSIVLRFLAHVLQDGVDTLRDQLEEFICVYVRPSF